MATSTTALTKYDAACRAIAAARTTDEAAEIRNRAVALKVYARQAKNIQLERDAIAVRLRAERRIGELMNAQRQTVGLNQGANGSKVTGSARVPVKDERPTLADAGIDKHLAHRARRAAALPPDEFERTVESVRQNVHHTTGQPEHYTPQGLLAVVYDCLGAIDLDPCSNDGEPNVVARRYYTRADDGLSKPWSGHVFMNPPYGREIDEWVKKLVASHVSGDVSEAIALLPARTDTQWFVQLRDYVCCFIEGRLVFGGNDDPAPFPSVLFYLGEHVEKFYHCFVDVGDIWQRLEPGMFGE